MTADAPPGDPIDLLVIGGLTIDRFADGRRAPGGSVLHAGRAAARAGLATSAITVAGPEPVAAEGVAELRELLRDLVVETAEATIAFRHRETAAGRRLWLEAPGGSIRVGDDARGRLRPAAILFGPVAAELATDELRRWPGRWRAAILQGWLRRADEGGEVHPIAPGELPADLVAALAELTVLVASREDLLAAAASPSEQITILREAIGPGPTLVVTDGPDGAWIDVHGGQPRHLPAPWRVDGVPTVGAGDAFAALYVARLAEGDAAAERAMRGVAEMLESRR